MRVDVYVADQIEVPMSLEMFGRAPIWQIPRADPGFLYIVTTADRLKIGKSKNKHSRLSAARTWLPDMQIAGVKPFWEVSICERQLHAGLAQWWYEGEWFDPNGDAYLEDFLSNFRAFSDDECERDKNSVNFLYWMHDFGEIIMEQNHRRQALWSFQRDVSRAKRLT
jgi:hypothetical protein